MRSLKLLGATLLLALALPLRLLAQLAGPEFQVNTYTTSDQYHAHVASDATGGFVVVWDSFGQDGSLGGIFGRRYDSSGAPLGGEFQVNTYTTGDQYRAAVAGDPAGDFVVVWRGGNAIFGQRYSSSGAPLGGEFQVNTTTFLSSSPSVAVDPAGAFVVVWEQQPNNSIDWGVSGQRYDSSGAPLGGQFQVNAATNNSVPYPNVAAGPTGGFVVVWEGPGTSGSGVFGQRYDSTGATAGGQFEVDTTGDAYRPAVATDTTGGFLVVWQNQGGQDGDSAGIFGQRYDSSGATAGGEFQVNTYTTGDQYRPAVAGDSTGGFVVVWHGHGPGDDYGIFGQRYDSSGAPVGSQFQANTYTTSGQYRPAVAAGPAGDFVVVWESGGQDGSGYGVFGQRFCTVTTCINGDGCCPAGCNSGNDSDCPPPTTTTSTTTVTTSSSTTITTTTSTTTTTIVPGVGHLKCYKARDSRAKATYTADLIAGVAGFPNELGCTLRLGARAICVEVSKQNVSPTPPGGGPAIPPNAGSAFLSYKIKCPKQTVAPVALTDQFGAGTFTVGTPAALLVPALPGPANDHFKCYKAKDARPKASYTMNLIAGVAGFVNETGCTVKLGAKQICVQVTKQNVSPPPPGGGPGPGPGSGARFVSYKLKCPKATVPPGGFTDQFGAGTFTPGTAKLLLVPAQ